MDFKVVNAQRYETLVLAVPSSPDGYFVFDDLMTGRNELRQVQLRGMKPRHVKKLASGDMSVMGRYAVPDPDRPGFVRFVRCDPGTPDPLQPIGTSIHVGGVQEVLLDRSSQLNDAHRAVGEWWAQRLLNPLLDTGDGEMRRFHISEMMRAALAQKAGDFALILADLSRSRGITRMRTDYTPDQALIDAAYMAGVPATFSLKSMTYITDEGVVMAREGYTGETNQIWPPVPEATVPQ